MIGQRPTIAELEKILVEPTGLVEIAPDGTVVSSAFRKELETVLNRYSKENGSNTPDFVLADFLIGCLASFDRAVARRTSWYGYKDWGHETPNQNPEQVVTSEPTVPQAKEQ